MAVFNYMNNDSNRVDSSSIMNSSGKCQFQVYIPPNVTAQVFLLVKADPNFPQSYQIGPFEVNSFVVLDVPNTIEILVTNFNRSDAGTQPVSVAISRV
jgi:hypothetical protein